jgi:hypothetical protein
MMAARATSGPMPTRADPRARADRAASQRRQSPSSTSGGRRARTAIHEPMLRIQAVNPGAVKVLFAVRA